MKYLLYIFFLSISTILYSQGSGLIIGKIEDGEFGDNPLVFANVSVKGTDVNVDTDVNGVFTIENLKAGQYTLVCSFMGYITKEIQVYVDDLEPVELKIPLKASAISLDELLALNSAVSVKSTF